ncbi:MFS transporter, partial [Geodermatophilus sp. SYSU D00696]
FLAGQSSLLGITGWRWIFYVNVPLGLLAFAAVYRVLHLPHERREHRIDWPGALSLVTCIVPLLIVAEQGRTWGWTSASAVACYCIGAVGFGAFLLAERAYGDEALLPLRLFRNRTFRIAIVGSTVVGAAMFGGLLLLPQYLQIVHGSSATVAGLQMIPLVAGIMAGAASSGVVISRTGRYKVFPLAGTVLMATALASLSVVVGAGTSLGTLAPFMVLLGIGLGFNFQPAVLAVQNAVPPDEMGVATSSVTFFRQMGATLGTAAFLSVLVIRLPVEIEQAVTSAAAGDPRVAEAVQSGRLPAGGDLSDTSFVQGLPSHLALPFEAGFSDAIDLVFLIAACVAALGFFVFLLLPQLALSTTSGIEARQAAARRAAGAPAAGATTEQAVLAAGAAAPMSTPRPTGRPRHAATRRTRPPIPVPPGRRWLLAGLGRATSAAPPRRVRGRTRHLLVSAAALGMLIGAGGAVQASRDPGDGQAADGRTSAVGGGNADTPVSTGPTLIPSPLADTTLPEPSPPVEQETTSGGAVPSPAAGGTPLVQAPPATTAAGTTAAGTTAAGTTAAGTTAAGTTAAGTTAVPTTETAVPTTETAVPTTETAVPTTETAVPTTETAVPTTE